MNGAVRGCLSNEAAVSHQKPSFVRNVQETECQSIRLACHCAPPEDEFEYKNAATHKDSVGALQQNTLRACCNRQGGGTAIAEAYQSHKCNTAESAARSGRSGGGAASLIAIASDPEELPIAEEGNVGGVRGLCRARTYVSYCMRSRYLRDSSRALAREYALILAGPKDGGERRRRARPRSGSSAISSPPSESARISRPRSARVFGRRTRDARWEIGRSA